MFGSRPFILKSLIEIIDIIGYYITFVVSLVKGRYNSPYFIHLSDLERGVVLPCLILFHQPTRSWDVSLGARISSS
jgi:hypothetical protein